MLKILDEYFKEYPARKKVVEVLYKYGLSIRDGKIFLGEMMIPISVISRYASVNRKIVYHTIEFIEKDYALRSIFVNLVPVLSLHEIAPLMGWEVIEIDTPREEFGCLVNDVLTVLSEQACNIRQITGMDNPDNVGRIRIVVEGTIPMTALEKIKDIPNIAAITIKTSEKDKSKLVCHHCRVQLCNRRI